MLGRPYSAGILHSVSDQMQNLCPASKVKKNQAHLLNREPLSWFEPEAEVCFLRGWPPLAPWLGEECVLEGGGRGLCPGCSGGGGGRPILLFLLSPASEKRGIRYRWQPCTFSMIRVEDPGSSFMLCRGPGPPSLLCMTRANEKSPYAGGTTYQITSPPQTK